VWWTLTQTDRHTHTQVNLYSVHEVKVKRLRLRGFGVKGFGGYGVFGVFWVYALWGVLGVWGLRLRG